MVVIPGSKLNTPHGLAELVAEASLPAHDALSPQLFFTTLLPRPDFSSEP
jgi:hypothetical protein